MMVTSVAPVNIAVIKYWGKRDEDLILPINDSLSGTLSVDAMCTKTTILASSTLKENIFLLNGKKQSFENPRLLNCLREIRSRANPGLPQLNWNLSICSENNFPTAAGLASSAAGYACLVHALAALFQIEGDISAIARRGSGSACRSIFGGWVQWCMGSSPTGEDSIARPIAPASHWPEMRVLILVVDDQKKKYSSTTGMQRSVETSKLLEYRATEIVPKKIEAMKEAILMKDFEKFARITMEDSNQFHAVCLDTFPPCVYMNDTSHAIVNMVHTYNKFKNSSKVAYTFDAGPNACLYLLDSVVDEIFSVINYVFPPVTSHQADYITGIPITREPISEELKSVFEHNVLDKYGALRYLIHTTIGDGPKTLNNPDDHLLNLNGLPKRSYDD